MKKANKQLHFTHLHLANWRNFLTVDVDVVGRAFLVGPNVAGKIEQWRGPP